MTFNLLINCPPPKKNILFSHSLYTSCLCLVSFLLVLGTKKYITLFIYPLQIFYLIVTILLPYQWTRLPYAFLVLYIGPSSSAYHNPLWCFILPHVLLEWECISYYQHNSLGGYKYPEKQGSIIISFYLERLCEYREGLKVYNTRVALYFDINLWLYIYLPW